MPILSTMLLNKIDTFKQQKEIVIMNANNEIVVEQVLALLTQANAHVTFDEAASGIKFENLSKKPENVSYNIWQLAEHIRITQWDILEFSRKSGHTSPYWPDEYWPKEDEPDNEETWKATLEKIKNDRNKFIDLLTAEGSDLYTPFEWGEGQNLLREALVLADHTSYHTGQIITIRKMLADWDTDIAS